MANEPARNPPAPLTPDEELAWRALARAVLVIPKVLDGELLQAQGLGLTEYSVLMNLSEQPGRSMRMSELANAVMISVSGLTRVVERLTRQGLAERVKAGTDGRGQLAVLTPAGFGPAGEGLSDRPGRRARACHGPPGRPRPRRLHPRHVGYRRTRDGLPVRRPPNLASLRNGRRREKTTGPQGAR